MNIVEQLQDSADSCEFTTRSRLLREAAAEIERLRERCEAYKQQVWAGSNEIERLRAAIRRYMAAVNRDVIPEGDKQVGEAWSEMERLTR